MPTGKDFTDEQWQEIYAVRARLEAYKLKIQPYPLYPLPLEGEGEPKEQVIVHHYSNMSKQDWDLLQQTALKADYLAKQLKEVLSRRKPKPEPKTAPRVYEVEK